MATLKLGNKNIPNTSKQNREKNWTTEGQLWGTDGLKIKREKKFDGILTSIFDYDGD